VGSCCYEVGDDVAQEFNTRFTRISGSVSILAARNRLDLAAAVAASLGEAGIEHDSIADVAMCTAHTNEQFFSYRAESGRTGRHGAVACILG
jgi:copper oxidase (laccase) domain-containing protein